MKLIEFGYISLLCTVALAAEVLQDIDVLQDVSDLHLQPLPISFLYEFNNRYVLSVALQVNVQHI